MDTPAKLLVTAPGKAPRRHTYNPRPAKRSKVAAGPAKFISGIVSSAIAVGIILFAMGYFPQVDAFWTNLNANLQSHNDQAVHLFFRAAPTVGLLAGILLLFVLLKPSTQGDPPSRSKT